MKIKNNFESVKFSDRELKKLTNKWKGSYDKISKLIDKSL